MVKNLKIAIDEGDILFYSLTPCCNDHHVHTPLVGESFKKWLQSLLKKWFRSLPEIL